MTRKLSIFVIFISCYLSVPIRAQQDTTRRINFGSMWKGWSNEVRLIYLDGFIGGRSETFLVVFDSLSPEARGSLRLRTTVLYNPDVLRDVMTDLYSDPANTFVRFEVMVYIARDKLSGREVESRLRSAREQEYAIPRR